MPALPFLCPSFLHFRRSRSRSQKSSAPLIVHDDATAPPILATGLTAFPPPSSRPSSGLGVPEVIRSPASDNSIRPQYLMPHLIDSSSMIIHTNTISASNSFMELLFLETIPGAAVHSSARDPSPRSPIGALLTVLGRCLYFISHCDRVKKMRWIFGAAGVGKSDIMQSVANSPVLEMFLRASVFFHVNGRDDGYKAILTISYQLATKSETYRRFVEDEIARNPSLLRSSMPIQFDKFIVQPFIHNASLSSAGRVLIMIDGLDECNQERTQVELLRLISDFCISHPSSPIVWLISSRPELHITSFFARPDVAPAYEKEEIVTDSNKARLDVQRFLRQTLAEIGVSPSLHPQLPDERDVRRITNVAGGFFAYAHAANKYIGDSNVGDPGSQLSDIPYVIDRHMRTNIENLPPVLLDLLHSQFLSNIPPNVLINTRKLLLSLAVEWDQYLLHDSNLVLLGNWLGMTPDEVYAATDCLDLVLHVPSRNKCHEEKLEPLHKSFMDHLTESRFFGELEMESQKLKAQCAFRILEDAPDGLDLGDMGYGAYHGTLARGSGTGERISLTWLAGVDQWHEGCWNDNMTRFGLYNLAVAEIADGMARGDLTFQSESCIHLLTTRFKDWGFYFPYYSLRDLVFDRSHRDEFMMRGILKQIPLNAIDASSVAGLLNELYNVKLNFRRIAAEANLSDRWDQSCTHEREEGDSQSWTTTFKVGDCDSCSNRLRRQLEIINTQSSDCAVPILFTSSDNCCVEFQFVDPEDGMSEWTYWFWYALSWEERKKYGSDV